MSDITLRWKDLALQVYRCLPPLVWSVRRIQYASLPFQVNAECRLWRCGVRAVRPDATEDPVRYRLDWWETPLGLLGDGAYDVMVRRDVERWRELQGRLRDAFVVDAVKITPAAQRVLVRLQAGERLRESFRRRSSRSWTIGTEGERVSRATVDVLRGARLIEPDGVLAGLRVARSRVDEDPIEAGLRKLRSPIPGATAHGGTGR